jgi:hypothetical protein
MRSGKGIMARVRREMLLPTATVLGPSHPLVETIETLAEARRQLMVVVVILFASLAPASLGTPWAQTAALAAATMICVLATAVLTLRRRRRRQALDLILEGREGLPVAAVEEERRRLLDPRRRTVLGASFENLANDALSAEGWPTGSVVPRPTITAVADQLHDVGSLLRSGPSAARGVALAEYLLSDGTRSPLYGGELTALHHELRRIRFLLASKSH